MHRDDKEDIHLKNSKDRGWKIISVSPEIDVLILGGGRAAEIKGRSFLNQNIEPDIYSEEIESRFLKEKIESGTISRISEYSHEIIGDYHIIIAATSDEKFNGEVLAECRKLKKLCLYGPEWRKGNIIVPMQISTENADISVSTKSGSPMTSVFISEKIRETAEKYDDFIDYAASLRKKIRRKFDEKKRYEIMKFINSDDFFFFFERGKADTVLKLFYGGEVIEDNSGD